MLRSSACVRSYVSRSVYKVPMMSSQSSIRSSTTLAVHQRELRLNEWAEEIRAEHDA